MRTLAAVVLIAIFCPALAVGQSSKPATVTHLKPSTVTPPPPTAAAGAVQDRALRHARIKIWTGIAMVAAGAVLLPITSSGDGRSETSVTTGVGLMAVGSGVMYWGFSEQRRAVRPSISFGVTVGRTTGVIVRRRW